jgi:hypothetical protein
MAKFFTLFTQNNNKEKIFMQNEDLNLIIQDLKNYYQYAKTNLQDIHLKFIDLKKNISIKEEKNIVNDHMNYIQDTLIRDSLKNLKNKIDEIVKINALDLNDNKKSIDKILNIIQGSISQDIHSIDKGIKIFDEIINIESKKLHKKENLIQDGFVKKELNKEMNLKNKKNDHQIHPF